MKFNSVFSKFQPKQYFLFISFLFTSLTLLFHFHNYKSSQVSQAAAIETKQYIASNELQSLYRFATETLHKHYNAIINSDGTNQDIQAILKRSAYEGNGLVRFIWADDNDTIILSSHTQHLIDRTKLSNYPIILQAKENVGKPHFSQLTDHPAKGMNRQIITYSIGVEHPQHTGYFGTLFATIDLYKLKNQIAPLLKDCDCRYRLLSPKGELIMASDLPYKSDATAPPIGTFSIELQPEPATLVALRNNYLARAAISLIVINGVLAALYLLIRHRILRPVSQALAIMIPSAGAQAGRPPIIEEPLGQLSKLAEHYQHMQSQLAEKEALIATFSDVMQQLQSQQQRFLQASGSEMHGMFEAVCGYASHLEERILQQKLDPDTAYDFDDVREMGDNLQHLSQCFLGFTQTDTPKIEAADPDRILRQTLLIFEPMLERRNLTLQLERGRDVWVMQPAAQSWIAALHRAMLYAAIRYAEDESCLQLSQKAEGEMLQMRFEISHFKQSTLPPEDQDFGMFMPSLRQDMTSSIERLFERHANIMVAEAISTKLHGQFALEVGAPAQGFTFVAALPHQLPKA
jgi:signal transduction histidine kinase